MGQESPGIPMKLRIVADLEKKHSILTLPRAPARVASTDAAGSTQDVGLQPLLSSALMRPTPTSYRIRNTRSTNAPSAYFAGVTVIQDSGGWKEEKGDQQRMKSDSEKMDEHDLFVPNIGVLFYNLRSTVVVGRISTTYRNLRIPVPPIVLSPPTPLKRTWPL